MRTTLFTFIASIIASSWLVACSCSDDPTPTPCKMNEECPSGVCNVDKKECSNECTSDSCADGSYCNSDNRKCTTDCGGDKGDCGNGAVCNAHGMCLDTGGGGDTDCPDITVDGSPVTPTVVLLIDQSSSMTESFGGGKNRWEAVHDALVNADGVVTLRQDSVIFGASLYSWNGDEDTACPQLTSEAPAISNLDAIKALLEDNDPINNTPTKESFVATADNFPAADGPRVILLATDGDPDTCEDPNSNGEQAPRTAVENAVKAAYDDKGIETYVLSVGDDATATHLDRVARAGRGQNLDSGTATAYVATSPEELVAAFDEIVGIVRSCDFKLDGTVADGDEASGVVILNGTPLEYGTDWELENGDTVHILGDSCTELLEADDLELTATFPCGTILL